MSTERFRVTIEAGRAEQHYWRDLWRFRELFYVLAQRDVAVRYKQTAIGAAWGVLRPFLTMLVLTLVFGHFAKLPSDGAVPYALMVFAGLLPWQFFSNALSQSSSSLVGSSNLISKVYFPRLIVPTAAIAVALVDFLVSLAILCGLVLWYRYVPGWSILTLPFFLLMALLATLGPGLWIASLNVRYRDFQHVVPFALQLGLYISPVGFSASVIPDEWRLLYSLNPMVGVIEGFRWAILDRQSTIHAPGFVLSWCVIVLFLWWGIRKFRQAEKRFADDL